MRIEPMYTVHEYAVNSLLNEETAKQLIRSTWPSIKLRVGRQHLRSYYLGADSKGILYFKTTSGTHPGEWWYQHVQFKDLSQAVEMLNGKLFYRKKRLVEMLIAGDILVYCSDPSWLYFFKYVAWKNGYGLRPETRPNRRNNPRGDHSLCKHLVCVLTLIPLIPRQILNSYNKQKIFPTLKQRMERSAKLDQEPDEYSDNDVSET